MNQNPVFGYDTLIEHVGHRIEITDQYDPPMIVCATCNQSLEEVREDRRYHTDHSIECVAYGDNNVAIECEDCGEIITDYDKISDNDGDNNWDDDIPNITQWRYGVPQDI